MTIRKMPRAIGPATFSVGKYENEKGTTMRIGIQKLKPPQAAAVKNFHRCELKNFTGKRKTMQAFAWLYYGGLYWTRTSDPIDVNDVLYQLSQQTKSLGTKDSIA